MDVLLLKFMIDNLVVKHQDTPRKKRCKSNISGEFCQPDYLEHSKKENQNQ